MIERVEQLPKDIDSPNKIDSLPEPVPYNGDMAHATDDSDPDMLLSEYSDLQEHQDMSEERHHEEMDGASGAQATAFLRRRA